MMASASNDSVYVMNGARAAFAGGMRHIEKQIIALESAVTHNPSLAFDLAKTLVESVCKTIITEHKGVYDERDNLPQLFRIASQCVPFLPTSLSADVDARRSLKQTLNGLNTALHGICELRNAFGFASHGSDGPRLMMEEIQALLVTQAADTIIGFLYRVHQQDTSKSKTVQLEYAANPTFNEWLDDQCEPVQILSLSPYRPSDVLFSVDQEAYRDLLNDYENGNKTETQPENTNQEESAT